MDYKTIPTLSYNHRAIEAKWQKVWVKTKLDTPDIAKASKPFYNLMMFPYPSAEGFHVGNMYAFTGSDIYGRFKRMQGYDVFEPIGLDGFGMHSENYAFKIGRHPMDQAKITEKRFYGQLHQIGAMFDWTRILNTYDIDYYRWTQWLFVQLFKAGLAYRAKAEVNYCPSCKTVLADEQAIQKTIRGVESRVCERCGTAVERQEREQWFLGITAYAHQLLDHIASLKWSEKVKVAQTNWIGKKEGITITYPVVTGDGKEIGSIDCFTTRPDTNFGATFVVVAPENEFVDVLCHPERSEGSSPAIGGTLTLDSCLPAGKASPAFGGIRMTMQKQKEIREYVASAKQKSEQERIVEARKKTGVFTGLYCVNQLNNTKMPLYISDFVLAGFGTGAVVGVPGHDKRDFEFAQTFGLPIPRVVIGSDNDKNDIKDIKQVQENEGTMVNSGFLNGLDTREAIQKMMEYLVKKSWGKRVTTYHLRDWLISRQRYWGPPIPMIYCEHCAKEGKSWFTTEEGEKMIAGPARIALPETLRISKQTGTPAGQALQGKAGWQSVAGGWYPVPEDQLPVVLPYIDNYKPTSNGIAPLAKEKIFFDTICPYCGKSAVRETDVSDTFLDSSWYFLRYPSLNLLSVFSSPLSDKGQSVVSQSVLDTDKQKTDKQESENRQLKTDSRNNLPFDPMITKRWLPVDMYTGGAEHSVLHLMYARFITMALHDLGYLDFDEPFTNFFAHGLIIKDGNKMSKSKGNIVVPDEYIEAYGADALRLYLMFMGPLSDGGDFQDTGMEGMARWVGRMWRILSGSIEKNVQTPNAIARVLNKTIKKVGEDIEKRRYNTAIASLMELANAIMEHGGEISRENAASIILIMAPFTPHASEELWNRLHGRETYKDTANSVHRQPWPSYDPTLVEDEEVDIVVQVNGKMRGTVNVLRKDRENQAFIEKKAKASEKVQKYLSAGIAKTIFVPGKLINFVLL